MYMYENFYFGSTTLFYPFIKNTIFRVPSCMLVKLPRISLIVFPNLAMIIIFYLNFILTLVMLKIKQMKYFFKKILKTVFMFFQFFLHLLCIVIITLLWIIPFTFSILGHDMPQRRLFKILKQCNM